MIKKLFLYVTLILTVGLISSIGSSQTKEESKKSVEPNAEKPDKIAPWQVQITDVAGLPRVLLIGDSISVGYTLPVREQLKGIANVHRPPVNCHSSIQILDELDTYLGDKKWDVIFFNCGGHDITYRKKKIQDSPSIPPEEGGKILVPFDEYKKNLREIVKRLKKTDAKLIWASTTPMGKEYQKKKIRFEEDIVKYNAAAAEIMKEEKIPIVDFYNLSKPNLDKILRDDGVHYTKDGYEMLAKTVSEAIVKELPAKK